MGLLDFLNPGNPIADTGWLIAQWLIVIIIFLLGASNLIAPKWFPRVVALIMVAGSVAYAWFWLM